MKRRGAGTISVDDVGSRVRLQAWVRRRRDHGGVLFLDLRDRSGVAQVVVRPEEQPEVAAALQPVRNEWVVEIEGEVNRRSPEAVNTKIPTGELEVIADRGVVLARCAAMPFALEGPVEASEETRLRFRFLDLRREELARNLRLRHQVVMESLKFFDENDFLHVETPILTRSTPEGARDYLVPSRVHRGSFFALPQSPQLFKQILMVSGVERYVQLCRCFRDEDLRADRQPEFSQLDVEMSFVDREEVMGLIEDLTRRIFPLVDIAPSTPYPRMTYEDVMRKYGIDRPDLRSPLEIVDLSEVLGECGFRVFREQVSEGGSVRGIRVPGAASASRREVEDWAELVRKEGVAGVLTLRRRGGELSFQVKDSLTRGELDAAAEQLALEEGDLALLVAAPAERGSAALGALRVTLARHAGVFEEGESRLLWVTDFPVVDWNADEGRWNAVHHPFTHPHPEDMELLDSDPGAVRSLAYDLVLNGTEVAGGSIRIHDPELQRKMFGLLGISATEAEERFGFLLEALRYGAPPHGGIAVGLDRLLMLMAGASSIREVIAFPKTASAVCLMTDAPSGVDSEKLSELGIRVPPRQTS